MAGDETQVADGGDGGFAVTKGTAEEGRGEPEPGGGEGEDVAATEGPDEPRGGEEDAEEPADRPEEREGLDGGGMGKATDGCEDELEGEDRPTGEPEGDEEERPVAGGADGDGGGAGFVLDGDAS